jgi:hypothetical protein
MSRLQLTKFPVVNDKKKQLRMNQQHKPYKQTATE